MRRRCLTCPCARVSANLTFVTGLGASTACTTACLGAPQESCGGVSALRVFTLPAFTKLQPSCYTDNWDRMLPNLLQTSGAMTAARCSQLAAAANYTVWGVQNGNQCW